LCLEIGLNFDHAKADMSQLTHRPAEGGHFAFAALEQALIVSANHGVIAHGHHGGHIEQCKQAVNDGVDLIGYCVWSFTDVLSWLNGYQKRYGLVYVNRNETDQRDLRRVRKRSFYWYQDIINTNGQDV
jgi:hypothetical protein